MKHERLYYRVYGLVVQSEIVCPELTLLDSGTQGTPAVTIRYGQLPPTLPVPTWSVRFDRDPLTGERQRQQKYYCEAQGAPHQLLLSIHEVGRFLIRYGREIVVDCAPARVDAEVRLFVLGSCMAIVLHQRGALVLHSSAVATRWGTIGLAGPSGIGKSTLAVALHDRGYPLVCDDLMAVMLDAQQRPSVLPGYAHVKLWADTLQHVGRTVDDLPRVLPDEAKYVLPLHRLPCQQLPPLRALYVLTTALTPEVTLTPITGGQKLATLIANLYRPRLLSRLEAPQALFQVAAAVAPLLRVCQVVRPMCGFTLDAVVAQLEQDLERHVTV